MLLRYCLNYKLEGEEGINESQHCWEKTGVLAHFLFYIQVGKKILFMDKFLANVLDLVLKLWTQKMVSPKTRWFSAN